jgi:hypothetical protein
MLERTSALNTFSKTLADRVSVAMAGFSVR